MRPRWEGWVKGVSWVAAVVAGADSGAMTAGSPRSTSSSVRHALPDDPRPPWWALVSSVVAPVAMIGGWTLSQALQPSFDPVRDTISDLATAGMVAPWVMGAGLAVTGIAHCVTASGLREVPVAGRAFLVLGGLATFAVAMFPSDTHSQLHGISAAVGFGALGLWPALAARRGGQGVLSAKVAVPVSVVLLALVGVFVAELQQATPDDGALTGLTERLVAGAQSLWPLVVTVALRRRRRPV